MAVRPNHTCRRARAPIAPTRPAPRSRSTPSWNGTARRCCASASPGSAARAARTRSRRRLLAALRHYDELRDRQAVAGWLFQIAQRKIVDAARRSARTRPLGEQVEAHEPVWHDPEDRSEIWSQVARLPPKQREAVGLRYLADLSHDDIGAVMGTTAEAARRNVHEGLKRLRTELAHA